MKYIILAILCIPLLSSCGVKPSGVDGKPGHPRTYPDIATDPKP